MATLFRKAVAEATGTFLLVFFGTGVVASATLTGAQQGLWQVAACWGFGVALSIFATAGVSGAHLNPAVTVAFAVARPRDFPWRSVPAYVVAQLVGAVAASATVLACFSGALHDFETRSGIADRADAHAALSAKIFGEYFPEPGGALGVGAVTAGGAFGVEALGTAILMFLILALTDERNPARPSAGMVPFFIGFSVASLISVFAPLTQAGFNPARDFGPRLVAVLAGFDGVAIPGPRDGFWVYIVGPIVGAPLGALAYDVLVRAGLPAAPPPNPAMELPVASAGLWCADQAAVRALMREACAAGCDLLLNRRDLESGCEDGQGCVRPRSKTAPLMGSASRGGGEDIALAAVTVAAED